MFKELQMQLFIFSRHRRIISTGRAWNTPADAEKPARKPKERKSPETILERLRSEKDAQISGGIYHKVQIEMTYNSNHIEGSRLTHD